MTKTNLIERLAFLIENEGFEALEVLDRKEMVKPLIKRDWQGTGGKLGYRSLSTKYGFSVEQIRRICGKLRK